VDTTDPNSFLPNFGKFLYIIWQLIVKGIWDRGWVRVKLAPCRVRTKDANFVRTDKVYSG